MSPLPSQDLLLPTTSGPSISTEPSVSVDQSSSPPRSPSPLNDLSPTSPSDSSLSYNSPSQSNSPTSSSSSDTDSPFNPSTNDSIPNDQVPLDETFTPNSEDFLSGINWFTPLYPGAEITLCGALCQFYSNNKLSYTAIGKLLQLLYVLCPAKSCLPTRFYQFKKFFQLFSHDHVHQKICLKCKKSDCLCPQLSPENTAHLVNIEVRRQLEIIISSK